MCATYVKINEVYWRVTTQPPRDAGRFERSGGPRRGRFGPPLHGAAQRRPKGAGNGEGASVCVCVFITAGPSTKLFAWRGGDIGGHVLQETTSRGLRGLVCPSRTSERGGEGDCGKEGGGGEGERERALMSPFGSRTS